MKNTKIIYVWFPVVIAAIFILFPAFSTAAGPDRFKNSLGMIFVKIPAGTFYMGSCRASSGSETNNMRSETAGQTLKDTLCQSGADTDDNAKADETPQHRVRISKSFYLGKYEVTLAQFNQFITDAGRDDLVNRDYREYTRYSDRGAASMVSWNDTRDFIRWLNRKEKGRHYRLPTEAEWEYACRAGTTTIYSFGDDRAQLGKYAWYRKNAYYKGNRHPHSVGRRKPNPWGLHDMHGNVWEWCQDRYDENYYSQSPVTDPDGPSEGEMRVLRGGSWFYGAERCRAAMRYAETPNAKLFTFGFRLAAKLDEDEAQRIMQKQLEKQKRAAEIRRLQEEYEKRKYDPKFFRRKDGRLPSVSDKD